MPRLSTRVINAPLLRAAFKWRYDRQFESPEGTGACRGVFSTFAEAGASAPRQAPVGYDVAPAAQMYRDRLARLFPSDYPPLFWLREFLPRVSHVVDLGGHVGVSYYSYRRHLALPASLRWTVCDVPAVAEAGRALAATEGASALRFVSELREAGACEVLFANGSLQYIEPPLTTLLRSLPSLPRHVLVNKTPTHATRSFVTLQNIGVTYCPYRIAARDELPAALAPLGYRLVDTWENADLRCEVPFEHDAGPVTYVGYALTRDEAGA